jgi:hypothetical protein
VHSVDLPGKGGYTTFTAENVINTRIWNYSFMIQDANVRRTRMPIIVCRILECMFYFLVERVLALIYLIQGGGQIYTLRVYNKRQKLFFFLSLQMMYIPVLN